MAVRIRTLLLAILACLHAVPTPPSLARQASVNPGRVFGSVLDPADSVIPGAEVSFRNGAVFVTAVASVNGTYSLEAPPGIYSVTCTAAGFFRFRRAAVQLLPGSARMINMYPLPSPLSFGDESSTFLSYDEYEGVSRTNSDYGLLVQYASKSSHRGVADYRGAAASYDAFLCNARKVRYSERSRTIEAWDGVLDDGLSRRRFRYLELVLPTELVAAVSVRKFQAAPN